MYNADVKVITSVEGQGLQVSVEPQLCALSARYAARGLLKSVHEAAAAQIQKEEETRALAPDAYRLSLLTEAAVNGRYRLGKEEMSSSDLVRYFFETRAHRIRNTDFSGNMGIDECTGSNEKQEVERCEKKHALVISERIRALPQTAGEKLKAAVPTWFNSAKPDTSREKKRFPLSGFAAIAAVAISLMLIVASSVLVMRGESRTAELNKQITAAYSESGDLQAKLETRDNLLLIRQIATEEYGMVDEEYVRTQYITLATEDSIETYGKDTEETGMSLSALLSAIGLR